MNIRRRLMASVSPEALAAGWYQLDPPKADDHLAYEIENARKPAKPGSPWISFTIPPEYGKVSGT